MISELSIEQARTIDLIDLSGQRVELHRESATEWSGPCPRCGGDDRFHVKVHGFFCRNRACWPDGSDKFGDPIAYVRWLHGVDFAGAIEILTGNVSAPTPRRVAAPMAKQPGAGHQFSGWADKVTPVVTAAAGRIEEVAEYLALRGIDILTALTFGLGYRTDAPLPGTWDAQAQAHTHDPQSALMFPWYRGKSLVAARYRFLGYHDYTDNEGKERSVKQSSIFGSDFKGVLYGGHVLPEFCTMPIDDNGRCAEQLRTLVLCEGELNAMSIWQLANGLRWDVLSLGSESQKLTDSARDFAGRYGHVIVWMDKPAAVKRLISQLGNATGVSSPVIDGTEHDANDLLRTGQLLEFLLEARQRACQSEEERMRFHYDRQDAQL